MKPQRIPHGTEPSPSYCPRYFTMCCQGLWDCSCKKVRPALRKTQSKPQPGIPRQPLRSLSTRRNNNPSVQSQVPWLRSCPSTGLPPPLRTAAPRRRSLPVPLAPTTRESCCSCGRQGSPGQQTGNGKICFHAPFFVISEPPM